MEIIDNIKVFIGWAFICVGLIFLFIGILGILRLPNFFARLHPAGMVDSLAVTLICFGFFVLSLPHFFSAKILLVAIFLLFTAPVACFAIANSALEKASKNKTSGNEEDDS